MDLRHRRKLASKPLLQLLGTVLFFASQAPFHAQAVQVSPVYNFRLMGGQYFFGSEESKLNGNFSGLVAPAIAFNEKWSLIPTLSTSWRGTKSVQDLVGGGTLFQQTQDHSASVKGIYTASPKLLLKAGGGYRLQLLKETNDEKWGKGLFDFQKPSANLEAERVFSKDASLRVGYDYYLIDFRNFSSLESQQKELGRENAGAKTLNTSNHGVYLAGTAAFPFLDGQKGRMESALFYTRRSFAEQKIVILTGDLSGDSRADNSEILSTSFLLPFVFSDNFKILSEIKGAFNLLSSNQNNYDAAKTRFNPNFYAYKEWSAGPSLNYLLGEKPWILTTGFTFVQRAYDERPTQDSSGNYGSDKVKTNEYYGTLAVTYPLTKNFKVQAVGNFLWARSNMKYEKTYRYNYEVATYLIGVTFDY